MKISPINYYHSQFKKTDNCFKPQNLYSSPYQQARAQLSFCGIGGSFFKHSSDLISRAKVIKILNKNKFNDININLQAVLTTTKVSKNLFFTYYSKKVLNTVIELMNNCVTTGAIVKLALQNKYNKGDNDKFIQRGQNILGALGLGFPLIYTDELINSELDENEAKLVIDAANVAYDFKEKMVDYWEDLDDKSIQECFYSEPRKTYNARKLFGEKSFIHILEQGPERTDDVINNFGVLNNKTPYYQELLKLINPTESEEYKLNEQKIKILKSKFSLNNVNKNQLIKDINSLTHSNRELIQNSIKDLQQKLDIVWIFHEMSDHNRALSGLMRRINTVSKKEKVELNNYINKYIKNIFGIKKANIDFRKNINMTKLFQYDEDFLKSMKNMVSVLEDNPQLSNSEAFDKIKANRKTKQLFKKFNLNYKKWTKYNPNSYIDFEIKLCGIEQQKQNIIMNLENDFSHTMFDLIPTKDNIIKALNNKGYYLKEKEIANYNNEGVLIGKRKILKLFKGDSQIAFEDVSKIINIVKQEMAPLFSIEIGSLPDTVANSIHTLRNHFFIMRRAEIKSAKMKVNDKPIKLRIQKVDMNNIEHALFLGNDAGCCTAVGTGCNQWSAPRYITFKFISSIEVKDENESIGNTMCFIAHIDGKPALVLDNIEIKPPYQYNNAIRDKFIEYAKKLTYEISENSMEIYAGANLQKVDMEDFPLIKKEFKILGDSGANTIYIDCLDDLNSIDVEDTYEANLYKIT